MHFDQTPDIKVGRPKKHTTLTKQNQIASVKYCLLSKPSSHEKIWRLRQTSILRKYTCLMKLDLVGKEISKTFWNPIRSSGVIVPYQRTWDTVRKKIRKRFNWWFVDRKVLTENWKEIDAQEEANQPNWLPSRYSVCSWITIQISRFGALETFIQLSYAFLKKDWSDLSYFEGLVQFFTWNLEPKNE